MSVMRQDELRSVMASERPVTTTGGCAVPQVRFGGFGDDWEQRKLGEVTKSYSGGTPSAGNSEYYNGNIPFIRSAEINSKLTELYITENGLNNSSAKMVAVGDILYALYGATSGEVGISKINGAINQAVLAIRPDSDYNSQFIMQWLRSHKQKIIDKYLQGGQGNLSGSIVKDLNIQFANCEEQKKIGEFLKQLDDTIALHQRELDLLKQSKQGFLQKLFPKKGTTRPELRFAGFDDEWEECKLGDMITNGFSGGTPQSTNDEYYNGHIPFLNISDMNGRYLSHTAKMITESGLANSTARMAPKGTISLAMYASFGKVGIMEKDMATSQAFYNMVFDDDIVRDYVYVLLDKMNMFGEWDEFISEGTQKNLNAAKVKSLNVWYPSIQEQQKIGQFFHQLDQTIHHQEQQLAQLKLAKESFLQKMFV